MADLTIFSNLSSETRLTILKTLEDTPMTLSGLAKKMGTSIQALKKHTNRLEISGLIHKNQEGKYHSTTLAQLVINQLEMFEFLAKNSNYFKHHTFGDVPKEFLSRIGELNHCEFIKNPMQAFQRGKEVLENTNKFMHAITIQVPLEFFWIASKKSKKDTKFKMIFGKNSFAPKGLHKTLQEVNWDRFIKNGKVEEKLIDRIRLTLVVTDTEAFLVFPHKDTDETDPAGMFYSKNSDFRRWCLDVFDDYWNRAKFFSSSKLDQR